MFVTCRIVVLKKLTSSTNARGCDFDEYVISSKLVGLSGSAPLGNATFLALEDGKRRHAESEGADCLDTKTILVLC